MQATRRTVLLVVQVISFVLSMDRQRFNATHPAEENALSFLSPILGEIPTINWIVGFLCAVHEATIRPPGRRKWFWQFRSPRREYDTAVARVRTLNTALSIPIALLFVLISATELYFEVLGTYPAEKSWMMLTVNLVLFLSAKHLTTTGQASEHAPHAKSP